MGSGSCPGGGTSFLISCYRSGEEREGTVMHGTRLKVWEVWGRKLVWWPGVEGCADFTCCSLNFGLDARHFWGDGGYYRAGLWSLFWSSKCVSTIIAEAGR